MIRQARWGAVVIGAVAGLFIMVVIGLIVFLVAAALGASPDDFAPLVALAASLFGGQLVAGYTSGRFTVASHPAFHGSLAALLLYGIISALSLAAGSQAAFYTLIIFAVVAMVLGMAGGVLAARPRDEDA